MGKWLWIGEGWVQDQAKILKKVNNCRNIKQGENTGWEWINEWINLLVFK